MSKELKGIAKYIETEIRTALVSQHGKVAVHLPVATWELVIAALRGVTPEKRKR